MYEHRCVDPVNLRPIIVFSSHFQLAIQILNIGSSLARLKLKNAPASTLNKVFFFFDLYALEHCIFNSYRQTFYQLSVALSLKSLEMLKKVTAAGD